MKRVKILAIAFAAIAVLAVLGWWLVGGRKPAGRRELRGPMHRVSRGDMLVSITEGGSLEAIKEVRVVSEVTGQRRIISIVEEGSEVKEGQLLVELDASDLFEKRDQEEISFQSAQAAYEQARESLEIRKSLNATQTKDAELKVTFARIDLEKYRDGEWPLEKKNAESAITVAQAELEQAKDRLSWTEKLHDKGYATRSELESDRLVLKRKEIDLQKAKENLRLMEKYTYPQRITKLEADLEKVKDEFERVKRRAAAELAQETADLKAKEATKGFRESKLKWWNEQIEKTKIKAPQSGLVVLPRDFWRRGSGSAIEVGAMVHERMEILTLPDTSSMKVVVKIHESSMNLLKLGQLAVITIDALPESRYHGKVSKLAVMPDPQNRWLNPNLKVYSTEILVADQLPEGTKPGLSAKVEILITKLEQIIKIPIQAVTTIDGKQVCFVREGDQLRAKQVIVGMFNDSEIEIAAGLKEGELVLLNPPAANEAESLGIGVVTSEEVTAAELQKAEEDARRLAEELEKRKKEEAAAGSGDQAFEEFLARIPEDRREEVRKRFEGLSAAERQKAIERFRSGGGRRRGGTAPADGDKNE